MRRIYLLPRGRVLCTLCVCLLGACGQRISAGDWPQILGPARNGVAQDESLEAWTGTTLPKAWSWPLGAGYAGPAVVGDRVYVFHRPGEVERVEALEAATGRAVWKTDFPAVYRGGFNPDTGPRCVPVVSGKRLVVFGAAGDLHCLDRETGKALWSRPTYTDFGAPEGYFGAGSTPIVVQDRVLVNVGGRQGAGIVAFSLEDGRDVWSATDAAASYSSPIQLTVQGRPHVLFVARLDTVCVDPANGEVRFQFPFGMRGPTVNAAMPLAIGSRLFLTASYGIGATLRDLEPQRVVWANDDSLSSQYSTPVYHDGFLYGTHGREDVGVAAYRCVELDTGRIQWSQENLGVAHTIRVNEKLLILTVEGRLILAPASPRKFEPLAEARLSSEATRALPALSRGRLFLRDNRDAGGALHCFTLNRRAAR